MLLSIIEGILVITLVLGVFVVSTRTTLRSKFIAAVILLIPIWLPFLYMEATLFELKFTHGHGGLLNSSGLFLLFAAPAIGGLPILTSSTTPLLVRLLVFPFYYLFGIFVAGIIGWGLCMEMHVCH